MADNFAVFTKYQDKYVLMHIENNRAEHIYAYDRPGQISVGSIINCRTERPMDNIDACFVQYSPDSLGFINKKIKGQTVLPLMLKKEAYDDKKAAFTDKLSIAGRYAVVSEGSFVKLSHNIPQSKKEEISQRFQKISKQYGKGIIIRTKAFTEDGGLDKAESECIKIIELLEGIVQKSSHVPQYHVLYRPPAPYIEDLLYLIDCGISEIITDSDEIKEALTKDHEYISGTVNMTDRVGIRMYEDPLVGLCNLYGISAKISEALSKKVYLKSGAYITIEKCEAFTAVDVNSAGLDAKADREESFLNVNIEAAEEIARQLVLRNISGMIIIDFINMKDDLSYIKLADAVRSAIKSDRANTKFIDFTHLKLCEITRSRSSRSLYQCLRGCI
ncbi:MAG: ribonuclease E/G [Lachnospiraceae bacterium]|nr:ribonuclease E/G [Lachnospiraceae bacterium]